MTLDIDGTGINQPHDVLAHQRLTTTIRLMMTDRARIHALERTNNLVIGMIQRIGGPPTGGISSVDV